MRTFLTVGIARNGGKASVLVGPERVRDEHVEEVRKFSSRRVSSEFSEVQLWGSGEGIQKRIKLSSIEASIKPEAPKPEAPKPVKSSK